MLVQKLLHAEGVPAGFVGKLREYQQSLISHGVYESVNLEEAEVGQLKVEIGTLNLKNEQEAALAKELITTHLQAVASGATGQLHWQFSGLNQLDAVTIRVRGRTWEVEFSRLRRPINSLLKEPTLKTEAHQKIYEELKKALKPTDSDSPRNTVILQGAPGLGKTHCAHHYFYHQAASQHQMIAWLSGHSEEAFLNDLQALATQFRIIESGNSNLSDEAVVQRWCEERLGQWLLLVDDVQIDIKQLLERLPKRGGHVLMTTAKPVYSLPPESHIFSFALLSPADSKQLLKAYLGEHWETAGYAQKEEGALDYFSIALGGSPALLTQIALLVRKKCLSFERLMRQFQEPTERSLILSDTVFDQRKDQSFVNVVRKSWERVVTSLTECYPQLDYRKHEERLKEFIIILQQEAWPAMKETPKVGVKEKFILEHWGKIWSSLALTPLEPKVVRDCLEALPVSYDEKTQVWEISLAGLCALERQGGEENPSPAASLPLKLEPKEPEQAPDLPKIPYDTQISMALKNSRSGHLGVAILSVGESGEFKAWQLPTTNPYFIPRPSLSDEIAAKLPHKGAGQKSAELLLAATSGMGGIGKTELARHFITSNLSEGYQRRFWLTATTSSQLRNQFRELAEYLGLLIEPGKYVEDNDLIEKIHRWLSMNPGWLMVLDNADDYNSIAQWVPKEGGSVLVTTREPNPGTLQDEQIIRVPLLPPEEAIRWLYQLAKRDPHHVTASEEKAASDLVESLGYLPLAIAQAAAYLREQPDVLIETYKANFMKLLGNAELAIGIDKASDTYSRLVVTHTWQLSLEAIERYSNEKGWPNLSPYFLAACAYLAPKDIPVALLEHWFKNAYTFNEGDKSSLSYIVDEYLGQLIRYSLLERTGSSDLLSIHRLVQGVMRDSKIRQLTQPADEQKSLATRELFPLLAESLAEHGEEIASTVEEIKRRITLIPHLETVLAHFKTTPGSVKEKVGELTYTLYHLNVYMILGNIKLAYGDAKAAVASYECALPLGERYYGKDQPEVVAIILGSLGNVYGALGGASRKKELLEQALKINKGCYGEYHLKVAKTLVNLGNAYGALGYTLQQKELLEQALVINERHYDQAPHEVAITLTNLGVAYGALGDASQQKELLERALMIKEFCYGKDHPEVAITLTNLSAAYNDLGYTLQQKDLLERALVIFEHHYDGKDHPNVAGTLANLGVAYGDLGDTLQQKEMLERALVIFERHYDGKDHPYMAGTIINLGNAYGALGDASRQKELQERALDIFKRHYDGKDHPNVAQTLMYLGNAYGALDQALQQKELQEQALVIFERLYDGKDHPNLVATLMYLGNACGALGDASPKKQRLERALVINDRLFGNTYLFPSNIVEAIVAYEQALANNPQTLGGYHNLAWCYFIQDGLDKADDCFKKEIYRHLTPSILAKYNHFLVKKKYFNEAFNSLQQCLALSKGGEQLSYALGEINIAVTAIQQMIEAQPDLRIIFSVKGLALYLQAYCHLELKSDDVAIAQSLMEFEEWKEADNTDQEEGQAIQQASYYFLLGDIYEKAEDRTQAQSYYEKARQLNRQFAKIIKIPSSDVRPYYPSGSPIHSYKGVSNISEEEDRADAIQAIIISNHQEFSDSQNKIADEDSSRAYGHAQ